jgi:CDP-diacylglycerol--inositol 3-phosphatidyltransferase
VLAIVLGKLYSQEVAYGLMLMIAIDMMSHYAILYSSLSRGQGSHKDTPQSLHWALKIYYGSRPVLFILCAGQEGFLLLMYLHKMLILSAAPVFVDPELIRMAMLATLPLFAIKQLMNVIQLKQAATDIGEIDHAIRANRPKKSN